MSDLSQIVLLALLPAAGNFVGGVIAELWKPSARILSLALHAATGIVLAIVALELLPRGVEAGSHVLVAVSFAAGTLAYLLLQWLVKKLTSGQGEEGSGRMWMIYIAVATDLASDGIMIGTGAAISIELALVLGLGQVLADVPEGYAAIANFRDKNIARGTRLLLSASFTIPVVGGAVLSYSLLRQSSPTVQAGILVMVAGLLTMAAVEDILKEAHESKADTSFSLAALAGGFVLFTLLTGWLGE